MLTGGRPLGLLKRQTALVSVWVKNLVSGVRLAPLFLGNAHGASMRMFDSDFSGCMLCENGFAHKPEWASSFVLVKANCCARRGSKTKNRCWELVRSKFILFK